MKYRWFCRFIARRFTRVYPRLLSAVCVSNTDFINDYGDLHVNELYIYIYLESECVYLRTRRHYILWNGPRKAVDAFYNRQRDTTGYIIRIIKIIRIKLRSRNNKIGRRR